MGWMAARIMHSQRSWRPRVGGKRTLPDLDIAQASEMIWYLAMDWLLERQRGSKQSLPRSLTIRRACALLLSSSDFEARSGPSPRARPQSRRGRRQTAGQLWVAYLPIGAACLLRVPVYRATRRWHDLPAASAQLRYQLVEQFCVGRGSPA